MRDGSPVPLPGHIQDVCETTAVPGAPAEKVGCRSGNVPASSLHCIAQFLFLSPPSSLLFPSPPLLFPYQEYKDGLTMGPVIELCREDHIRYIAPMEGSEGFFVPEVAMETTEAKKKQ